MKITLKGEIWYWRGPSPFHFITVPEKPSNQIKESSQLLSYGWGCIPAKARIGTTEFTTALIPKDGKYLIPIKTSVRTSENLELGDSATVDLYFEIKI